MFKRRAVFGMVLMLAGVAGSVARADVYAYTDEHGVLNITNVPSMDPRYKLVKRDQRAAVKYGAYRPITRNALQNPAALRNKAASFDAIVHQYAGAYRVDENLVRAVIHAESAYNSNAVSPKGARGLMQLMPGTARRYGVQNSFDPTQNVAGGVRYLSDLLRMFGHNTRLAVAAYNAGENSVLRYGGVPPYPETVDYVSRVLDLHQQYQKNAS